MTWAQRLKRVFGINIETCALCGRAVRIIACIEDAEIIEKILAHLDAMPSLGCDIRGAAVAVGQKVGVMGKSAPAHPSPGWIRAP